MEFFTPCWIALGMIFTTAPSSSYVNKVSRTFAQRLQVCNAVAVEARKQHVDIALAIAVSLTETGFTNTPSEKGARGPLGVIPAYHCPKKSKGECDYIKAGVTALRKFLERNDLNYCNALAEYNRGVEQGRCEKGRSEYKYAQYVLRRHSELCDLTDLCVGC
jgi:soluble lytic murein transglycosylase-like protein